MELDEFKSCLGHLDFSVRVNIWSNDDQADLVLGVLTIISQFFGKKLIYFSDDSNNPGPFLEWTECFRVFTAEAIFKTVQAILDGKYEKDGEPIPKTPSDFRRFMLNGNESKSSQQPLMLEEDKDSKTICFQKESSDFSGRQLGMDSLKKIREILGGQNNLHKRI